jgi:hypothetical protein
MSAPERAEDAVRHLRRLGDRGAHQRNLSYDTRTRGAAPFRDGPGNGKDLDCEPTQGIPALPACWGCELIKA